MPSWNSIRPQGDHRENEKGHRGRRHRTRTVSHSGRLATILRGRPGQRRLDAAYGRALDPYNQVDFTGVQTATLRLEVQLLDNFSGGLLDGNAQ